MLKAFKYKLYPTNLQEKALTEILETCRLLYNRSLAERRDAWQNEGRSLNYYDQANTLKEQRQQNKYLQKINFSASQDVLRRLNKAFESFFRRIRAGETPGYPRFKGKNRYNSVTFPSYGDGCKLKNNRLYIQHVGNLKIKLHRPVEGKIKTVTIRRQSGDWYVSFAVDVAPVVLPLSDNSVGIDLGLETSQSLLMAKFSRTLNTCGKPNRILNGYNALFQSGKKEAPGGEKPLTCLRKLTVR